MSALARALALLVGALAGDARAHDARPVYVELRETPPALVEVDWKVPGSLPAFALPEPVLPPHCTARGPARLDAPRGAYHGTRRYRCPGGLAGGRVGIRYPAANPSLSTVFRVRLGSGALHSRVLPPDRAAWTLPATPTRARVALDYTWLGVRHIAAGLDHLLFLACLLFIARTPRRVLITVTGFTLAHSATLAAATLGWVDVPVPAVEAVIALSIVFLAVEIAQPEPGSWTQRFPVAVASAFGLLHGLGFASVLRQVGLPPGELPTALLCFNLGVELGQLAFVGTFLLCVAGVHALERRLPAVRAASQRGLRQAWGARLQAGVQYAVGAVASFWLIDRVVGFWA